MLEFWSYSTTLSYSMFFGYPFKMYSEYPPLILQDLILFLLIMRSDRESQEKQDYLVNSKKTDSATTTISNASNGRKTDSIPFLSKKINKLNLFICITIAIHSMVSLRFFPKLVPIVLLSISSPIGVFSKFLQLYEIVSKKSSGSVSPTSWFLNFISSSCRLITVLMTVRDFTIVYSLGASAILNLTVSITALYYSPINSDNNDQRRSDAKNNNIRPENEGTHQEIPDKKIN
jgi:hypothetical protein